MKRIRLFEMFAGTGGASFALKKAGIPFECVGISEIDKYAILCFGNNFQGIANYGDCRDINPEILPDFELLTGGFPCQPFSAAGKGMGEMDIRGTLFHDIIRIAEAKKPKYILLENVKGLTFKTHENTFQKILSELKRIGYDTLWKVLNSKDYGIPQNRERVFFVCKLGKWELGEFNFPEKEELKLSVADILEENPDEKYRLSGLMQERFAEWLDKKSRIKRKAISVQMGNINRGKVPYNPNERETGFCFNKNEGVSYTVKSASHEFMVYDRHGFKSRSDGFKESILSPTLSQKMGTGGNNVPMVSGAITQAFGRYGCSKEELKSAGKNLEMTGILRRLTPKECFRLMGFLDDGINLEGLSDTQKYRLAGNGWDVSLVAKLLKEMLKNEDAD